MGTSLLLIDFQETSGIVNAVTSHVKLNVYLLLSDLLFAINRLPENLVYLIARHA